MRKITGQDVQAMVRHWLGCPINGYLGSPYGSDIKAALQRPMSARDADELIDKLRTDVPIVGAAPPDSVNVFVEDRGIDRKNFLIQVGSEVVVAGT